MSKKRSRAVMLRITPDGRFEPADDLTRQMLRERGLHIGDVVSADITMPRSYRQWMRAHKLGQLIAENIEDFQGVKAHQVLKRLQLEGNIGCESIAYRIPEYGMVEQRIPKTLNFADMDETEFQEIYGQMCQLIINRYWNDLSQQQIETMANLVGLAA